MVYDLEKLGIKPMEIVHDLPAGEWRRVQKAAGYRWIMVNGQVTLASNTANRAEVSTNTLMPDRLQQGADRVRQQYLNVQNEIALQPRWRVAVVLSLHRLPQCEPGDRHSRESERRSRCAARSPALAPRSRPVIQVPALGSAS
ncbi:MAG TPA: hypothetical protein VGX03_14585 [Candidatus Binatia bacterium]|nr:hypothetical protein [Candidatus Binatia bacterium]